MLGGAPDKVMAGGTPATLATCGRVTFTHRKHLRATRLNAGVAHLAERDLPKVEVAGSIPVSRSTF
jgi:hypothetical protein